MIKRVVVAGCRDYDNYSEAKEYIEFCISKIKNEHNLIFVSGGCRGADLLGERFAYENGYQIERYPAEWGKYGRAAGPKRNMKMAEISDFVIYFWDGHSKGTKTMINYARRLNKPIRIKVIQNI